MPKGAQGGDSRCRTLVTEVLDAQSSWITLVSKGLETVVLSVFRTCGFSTCSPRVSAGYIYICMSLIVHMCICCPACWRNPGYSSNKLWVPAVLRAVCACFVLLVFATDVWSQALICMYVRLVCQVAVWAGAPSDRGLDGPVCLVREHLLQGQFGVLVIGMPSSDRCARKGNPVGLPFRVHCRTLNQRRSGFPWLGA